MMRVFCARSMHVAVTTLARQYAEGGRIAPDIVFEPMGALQARIAAGESADVLILAVPALEAMELAGRLVAGSCTAVARAPIGIAARADANAPDVATAAAFATAVSAARAVALSDPAVGGSAGIYLRDLFGRMGLTEIVAAKTVYQKSGVAAADAVGHGDADLALSFIPELLQGRGVRVLGPLPPPYGHATAYAAAISAESSQTDAGRAFIAALTASDAAEVWAAAGFDLSP